MSKLPKRANSSFFGVANANVTLQHNFITQRETKAFLTFSRKDNGALGIRSTDASNTACIHMAKSML